MWFMIVCVSRDNEENSEKKTFLFVQKIIWTKQNNLHAIFCGLLTPASL